MLQINIRPESTAVEIFNEISNRRWFVQYYRENNSSRCMYEGRNAMNFNESNVPEHYCGSMNSVCMHCGARFFNFERNTTGIYTTCCNEGKFILPSMSKPTELMQELFLGMTQKSKLFLKHPRFYNNHLSFASITMDEGKFTIVNLIDIYCIYSCIVLIRQIFERPRNTMSSRKRVNIS